MKMANREETPNTLRVILSGGWMVSLVFLPNLNDPFNAPKSWALSIFGFWLFGWALFQIKGNLSAPTLKWFTILAGFYLFTLIVGFVATDNKYIAMFGEYQRRTGFLSYFSLIIFLITASYIFRINNIHSLEKSIVAISFVMGSYGFAQHFKHDFVHWANPYNSVISTVGNPDFAGALMGIFLIINFGVLIQTKYKTWVRIFSGLNSFLLFVVIIFSQVRQGLLAAGLGISIVAIVWVHQRHKFIAYALSSLVIVVGSLSLFGMLNKGILAKYFYKMSITYRGDYWRAGWQMFIHHPLFGVGLDRYGANFRTYRDSTQSLRRGPDLVSTAAHNVPIQLLATGGIFVFLAYFALTVFILWRGVVALKRLQGAQQIIAASIFSAWIAYEAQSFVSIDNLGVAIWGYILGGALVGLSCIATKSNMKPSILQPIFSGSLTLIIFVIAILFYGAESSMHALRSQPSPKTQAEVFSYKVALKKPLGYTFKEPSFRVIAAGDLAFVSDFEGASDQLKNVIAADPLNYDAKVLLAKIYEYQKKWPLAVQVRKTIYAIDPYNQMNLLTLGEDEKSIGDLGQSKNILNLINSFAPNSDEARQALQDFGR